MKRASGTLGTIGAAAVFLGVSAFAGTSLAAQDGNGTATPPQGGTATVPVAGDSTPAPAAAVAGTAVKKDTAKKPAEEEKKEAPRRFAGSSVFVQTSANLNTFFPALQPNRNVTADMAAYITPRFAINDAWQLRGRLVFNYEFTNSDDTTTRNEPRFSDTTVSLFYRKVPTFGGGFKFNPFVSVGFPTSPESRARTMYFAPGIGGQISRGFEHVLGGEMLLLSTVTYTHPFYNYTTAGLRNPRPYEPQCFGGTTCSEQASGAANTSDSLSMSFLVSQEWGKWNPALFFLWSNQWAYKFQDLTGVSRIQDGSTFRQSTYFSAWLDYNANDWFTAEIGYYMGRNMIGANGKIAGPEAWIFDKYQDMRFYLGANLNLDTIAKLIEGKGGGQGGVVRAKNRHTGPLLGL